MSVQIITKDNFETEVLNSDQTVLIDFWAEWCGPCRAVSPIVEEISSEVKGLKVGKINVDEEPELSSAFNVMSIPTLIVFRNGQPVQAAVGSRPKAEILKLLDA